MDFKDKVREQLNLCEVQEALDLLAEVFAPMIMLVCQTQSVRADGKTNFEVFYAGNDGPAGTRLEEDASRAASLYLALEDFVREVATRFRVSITEINERVNASIQNQRRDMPPPRRS